MNRQDVERAVTAHLKPVFGFALKRCKSLHDAEDLTQEIAARAFRALLAKDDVEDMGKFIWTVAHNALSNYYRDTAKSAVGVSIDEVAEQIADPYSTPDGDDRAEALCRLRREIAHLSKLQRRIVIAYYFDDRRQADIARELGIPLGTVKWHLFEAKKELKRRMNTTRQASRLTYDPIKFQAYGLTGSVGTKSLDEFFRSALSQNICYCVRDTAKTVAEIADALGVSPVFVESEVEFLEEYGFLLEKQGRYIANFIISEPTVELLTLQNTLYRRAAELFANELYDALVSSGVLDDREGIICHQAKGVSLREEPTRDKNFLLWALIPYIAAQSGEGLSDERIAFEEVAVIRPDGGRNICHALIMPEQMALPDDYVSMDNWCGPMWNSAGDLTLWQVDSAWSRRAAPGLRFPEEADRVLALYRQEEEGQLSREDYAWLSERGYITTWGDYDGDFRSSWQIVILTERGMQKRLMAMGDAIKRRHKAELARLKAPYAEAVLENVPPHLRRAKAYELQHMFQADGWFLLHCITVLLKNGKLQEPTEEQRKALSTLIVPQ